jgi:hypothetical protein
MILPTATSWYPNDRRAKLCVSPPANPVESSGVSSRRVPTWQSRSWVSVQCSSRWTSRRGWRRWQRALGGIVVDILTRQVGTICPCRIKCSADRHLPSRRILILPRARTLRRARAIIDAALLHVQMLPSARIYDRQLNGDSATEPATRPVGRYRSRGSVFRRGSGTSVSSLSCSASRRVRVCSSNSPLGSNPAHSWNSRSGTCQRL